MSKSCEEEKRRNAANGRYSALAFIILIVLVIIGTFLLKPSPVAVSDELYRLGTVIKVTAYGQDAYQTERAVAHVKEKISMYDNLFSVNIPNSDIYKINHGNGRVCVKDETYKIISYSLNMANLTKGVFDPTIEPVVKLWGIGTDHAAVPSSSDINDAMKSVGFGNIVLGSNNLVITKKGSHLDLGAVAKGWIGDRIKESIENDGIKSAIVDLGGNIITVGSKPDGQNWHVALQNPYLPRGNYFGIVDVKDKTVVTSGAYERFFIENGVRYHHIFDTSTGYPAQSDLSSVTVISESSAYADCLCTTLFAMGFSRACDFVLSHNIKGVILLSKKHDVVFVTPDVEDILYITEPGLTLKFIGGE